MEYFVEYRGNIYAIMNWQNRKSASQVLERQLLKAKQVDTYCRMKAQGESDLKIYRTLFPPRKSTPRKPRIRKQEKELFVSKMTKPDIVKLLKKELKRNLSSLDRMNKSDLRDMYYILRRLKED